MFYKDLDGQVKELVFDLLGCAIQFGGQKFLVSEGLMKICKGHPLDKKKFYKLFMGTGIELIIPEGHKDIKVERIYRMPGHKRSKEFVEKYGNGK